MLAKVKSVAGKVASQSCMVVIRASQTNIAVWILATMVFQRVDVTCKGEPWSDSPRRKKIRAA